MDKKNAPTTTAEAPNQQFNSTSAEAQRLRLLRELESPESIGVSTIEAREQLNIMAPAPRIFELRWQAGKNIITRRTKELNAQGHPHLVARYILLPGTWDGKA